MKEVGDTYIRREVWVRKRFIGCHSLFRVEGLTTRAGCAQTDAHNIKYFNGCEGLPVSY